MGTLFSSLSIHLIIRRFLGSYYVYLWRLEKKIKKKRVLNEITLQETQNIKESYC